MSKGLDADQISFYKENGYLMIDHLFDPSDIDRLTDELNGVIDHWATVYYQENLLNELFTDEPFERRLFCLYEAMDGDCPELMEAISGKRKTPGMFHVMTLPPILDVVESLIGPEILVHPQFNSRAKLPDGESIVNWHQDISFLNDEVDDTFMVNFWLPLVDTNTMNGCLEVLPGSHKIGRLPFTDSPENINSVEIPSTVPVSCPVPKGGVLLIQHKTIHRSTENFSDHIRWSLDIRYSDHRMPTGRPDVPGFIARSVEHPEWVARNHMDWLDLFEYIEE